MPKFRDRRRACVAPALLLLATTTGSAVALSRQELLCQHVIGSAGKAFVTAELSSRARCKLAVARGRTCDPAMRTAVHEAKLRKVVGRCSGVSLSALGVRSCAATAANTSELADCLIAEHEAAVAALIAAQFGLNGAEREVVLSGQLAQAGVSLLPPAQLLHYKVSTAPLSLAELEVFCVTFADPPVGARAAVEEDGRFEVRLAAAGVPFGCSVVDAVTGEQMATLVFRDDDRDSSQLHVDEGGSLALGTVSLDLSTGEAVVDASSFGSQATCADVGGTPVDFTGAWDLECVPAPDGAGYGCPAVGEGSVPDSLYLHRLAGTAGDGTPLHWLGFWDDLEAFERCGGIEGLATSPAGTSTADGATLATPDGPFVFASDGTLQTALADVAAPGAAGTDVCNATAARCDTVQNYDGAPCTDQQGHPHCWGRTDVDQTGTPFVPYTDAQCRALCYAVNLYLSDVGPSAVAGAGLCAERKLIDFDVVPDQAGAVIGTGAPFGRHLFGPLRYACDDAASVVAKAPTRTIVLPQAPGATGARKTCHVTERAEVTLRLLSSTSVVGSYKRSASLQAGDPDACADADDPTNPVGRLLRPERLLFKLSR